tara:strand:+ start:1708 stop:1995 length:288 start_codon:yes stop_codon:yes gene_type:complete
VFFDRIFDINIDRPWVVKPPKLVLFSFGIISFCKKLPFTIHGYVRFRDRRCEDLEAADGSALAISTLVALSSKNGGRLHHISAMMAALTSAAETI